MNNQINRSDDLSAIASIQINTLLECLYEVLNEELPHEKTEVRSA